MTVFDPDPQLRWLFCLTHPDDELAISAWISQLVRQGNEVHLMWTHSTPLREAESRAATQQLGVPQGNLIFLDATDGSVCEELGALLPRFREVMRTLNPDRVACGAFEQGHIDHDATNWLVNHSFRGPVLEFPLYRTYALPFQVINRFSDPTGQEVRGLSEDEQELKIALSKAYPSQTIGRILVAYHAIHRLLRRSAPLATTERMRVQTHFDFDRPNHPMPLAGFVERSNQWQRWLGALRAVSPGLPVRHGNLASDRRVHEG